MPKSAISILIYIAMHVFIKIMIILYSTKMLIKFIWDIYSALPPFEPHPKDTKDDDA